MTKEEKSLKAKKYYDKFRKPKKTDDEKLKLIEERKIKNREYAKKYYEKHYTKILKKRTDEEKRQAVKDYSKKYYNEKIKANKPVKVKANKPILHKNKAIGDTNYINDIELLYNIIISQGQGKLNSIAIKLLFKLVEGVSRKFIYRCNEDREDIIQSGKLKLLESWMKFDSNKYDKCVPYYTELAKRAMATEYNILRGKHDQHQEIPKMISLSKWQQ